ncbi:MAG: TIGR03086 family protein [Hamadaea sp.]|uniref:TIGR03086 family metal-binding protein n=1 Tax=Hamadaea sp. TaxID=2024425 RepID=UPI00184396C6|nr:TIGR03086 family metal-binding protein [Hamadaea sp.]NUT18657.1 TIGR03086 family protein [Hamadaea sp.]
MTVIDRIDAAIGMAGGIVRGITAAQLDGPSPCAGWDLRHELNHLVGGMRIFAAELTGTPAGGDHHDDWLGDDHLTAYATAAALDRAAWWQPDALERTVLLSFGPTPGPVAALIHLTEVLVHGADLAVASSRTELVDDEACEQLLTTMQGMDIEPFRRMGAFGPAQPADDKAPAHRRLLAYLGRVGL